MIRVLDLTHYVAGPFATMLLAELGADVIKIEPPGGDPWRRLAPKEDARLGFEFLNRYKRSVVFNLKSRADRAHFLELVRDADAVVENFRPGVMGKLRLSYRTLRRVNPNIVLTSISNFGQDGPRSNWEASELVLQTMGGGFVHATGWEDGTPLKLGGNVAQHLAGLNAAIATLASIYGVRAGSEGGVHNDISIQEAFSAHGARHISVWAYSGIGMKRAARGPGPQGFPNLLPAQDGDLYILALRAEWEFFAHFLGLDQFTSHEWSDPAERRRRWAEIDPHFRAAIASRSRYDWFREAAEHGFTFAPVDDVLSVQDSPQMAERGFFHEVELSDGARVSGPGLPFSGFRRPARPDRAPRLGEHTDEVLSSMGTTTK